MTDIRKMLKTEYNLVFGTGECEKDRVCGMNKTMLILVVDGAYRNDGKWLVRISTLAGFDRWANSCAIEETFKSKEEVIQYFKEHKLEIYEELLSYLANEYDEVHYEAFENRDNSNEDC